MSLDNRVTQKPTTETITITRSVETSGNFNCISCFNQFYVYAGPIGLQTLFCTECMNALKNSIIREKQQNYGW